MQTGRIPRSVDGKVLPCSLRVPNAFSAGLSCNSEKERYDRKPGPLLAALHIGIPAISNLAGPVCLAERNFAVFPNRLFLHPPLPRVAHSHPAPRRPEVLFVAHKFYSPRDRRSFFCDSTSEWPPRESSSASGTAAERLFPRVYGPTTVCGSAESKADTFHAMN